MTRHEDEPSWPVTFDAHVRAQARRLAEMSLIEKLAWLEEAHLLVRALERSRAASGRRERERRRGGGDGE